MHYLTALCKVSEMQWIAPCCRNKIMLYAGVLLWRLAVMAVVWHADIYSISLWAETHFTSSLWVQNPNLVNIPVALTWINDNQISPWCCTCHDSWAVVACAKLWPDYIIWIKSRAKLICRSSRWWVYKVFVTWVPDVTRRVRGHNANAKSHWSIHRLCEEETWLV